MKTNLSPEMLNYLNLINLHRMYKQIYFLWLFPLNSLYVPFPFLHPYFYLNSQHCYPDSLHTHPDSPNFYTVSLHSPHFHLPSLHSHSHSHHSLILFPESRFRILQIDTETNTLTSWKTNLAICRSSHR